MQNKKIFIIDGSSFLYRAFYAMRPLQSPLGVPVQAVYGFCRMIKKFIDVFNPENIVLVWDSPGKNVRHDMYPEYKQNRQAQPLDLNIQRDFIKSFATKIGLKQISQDGVEADDLMYSLVKDFSKNGIESVVVTSDKDMGQILVYNLTKIYDSFKEEFVTRENLEIKLGFNVEKLPFYYALVGDSSDNIPGVKGVGPKTATQFVVSYQSLADLYDNIETLKAGRIKELLVEYKEDAFLSEKLFCLQYYKLNLSLDDSKFDKNNWDNAQDLFKELGFKSLLKTEIVQSSIFTNSAQEHESLEKKYKFICIKTEQELEVLCDKIKSAKRVALDTEGTGLQPLLDNLIGISVCTEFGAAYYVPFGHVHGIDSQEQLSKNFVINKFKAILEDKNIEKYLHHAKFDALYLYNSGINLAGITFDTMIAANLVNSTDHPINLKFLSQWYLKEHMLTYADMVTSKKLNSFAQVPLNLAYIYAASDAHQTMQLVNIFKNILKEKNLENIFYNIEIPTLNILIKMEEVGIKLDIDKLKAIDMIVSKDLKELYDIIIANIGYDYKDINLNSPKQLEELLFTHLKLPTTKKTTQKTGFSTDQEVLKDLEKINPIVGFIRRYREVAKIKSTYVDALIKTVNPNTHKIHTNFSQTIVATGRLSSSEPNLQNIPVESYGIRSAFIPDSGYVFLSADYSQIELRILAYMSQDANLINAFKNNLDIHAITAANLFDIDIESVTSEQRKIGKRINFSIIYGLSAFSLSKDLQVSRATAQSYIDKYMAQYPKVVEWMNKIIEVAKVDGYVSTLWGRRRYVPGLQERNQILFQATKRVAINTPVQGSAADIMKIGMINLYNKFVELQLKSRIILQIHDELLIEVHKSEIDLVLKITKEELSNVVAWDVPLVVNTKLGNNWQEITS